MKADDDRDEAVRVIAGSAGGRRLVVPRVDGLRPTTDRAREALFNVLRPRLPGSRVLDLFAGSGALAIEALSNGCASAVAVERDRRACAAIRRNLGVCDFDETCAVIRDDWRRAVRRLADRGARFDLVLMDPPYAWDGAATVLEDLSTAGLVAPQGTVVVEHRSGDPPEAPAGWEIVRVLKVGDSSFAFVERRRAEG